MTKTLRQKRKERLAVDIQIENKRDHWQKCFDNGIVKKYINRGYTHGLTQHAYEVITDNIRAGFSVPEIHMEKLTLKMTRYLIYVNAKNASEVRCKLREGYKGKYHLGDYKKAWRVMQNEYPEMFADALQIVENLIRNGMQGEDTLTFHRIDNNGDYAWNNLKMLKRKEHYAIHEEERKKEPIAN